MRQPTATRQLSTTSSHASQASVHGFVPGMQVPEPLHCSAPLHQNPSLQGVPAPWNVQTSIISLQPVTQAVTGQRAPAPVQAPALQVSVRVQNSPSLQAVPFGLADQAVVLRAGLQDWHWLPGLVAPVA